LFILDHHDTFMPYLSKINELEGNFIYATRTVLFLRDDGTLKPVAIELSLPDSERWTYGAVSQVHTISSSGIKLSIWRLAKAYVSVNDTVYHQLISHWLNTHAVIEPFVIATNRHLSVMHPIHKLLKPHFKDTMNINALARQSIINADGIIEKTFFPGKYALELSSEVYKSWKFTEQGLPQDLLKRGVAVEDPWSPNKLRLLIKDYPYAVDGLAVWSAIEKWVYEYCLIYYPDDSTVKTDTELQEWWKEIREVGHGDLKDETWWPSMQTYKELADTCTTVIWIASALHAAVHFGQYPYGGYHPNRPTRSRQPMPILGREQYNELKQEPDKVFLKTITSQGHSILVSVVTEILSRHPSDEVYLGQSDSKEWTSDNKALEAFNRFSQELIRIEKRITEMNVDHRLKNRIGLANMPYMLMYPNTSDTSRQGTGVVGKGIPNSVSI
jgi:linoleate 9S-lipoxygenase